MTSIGRGKASKCAPQREAHLLNYVHFAVNNSADRIMNLSYEHEPFSVSELAVGGTAVAAVALIAFLGVTFSQSPNPPPANPLHASLSPATTPGTSTEAPQPRDQAPAAITRAQPGVLTDGMSVRGSASFGPSSAASPPDANPEETKPPRASDFLVEAAPETIVEMRSHDVGGPPPPLIGPIDLLRAKDATGDQPPKPIREAAIPVSADPERNPSNRTDAIWIQTKLRDLGYFAANTSGVWGSASRNALRDFKTMNGLREDDKWDQETEKRLLSKQNVPASSTFIGGWAQSIEECQHFPGVGAPLMIRSHGAETDRVKCRFRSVKPEVATMWHVQAACSADGQSWNANVSLKLTGPNLNWSSEGGSGTYVRCLRP